MKLIKAPFGDGGLGKTKDTTLAPDAVENELKEIYLSENLRAIQPEVEELDIKDSNIKENLQVIENKVSDNSVVIGGDHSITYSSFRGSGKKGLIVFDAHPDLMEGTDTPSHEDYLRALVEEESLPAERIILVGVRNLHHNELEYLSKKGIKYFTAKKIYETGISNICDEVMASAKDWEDYYISVDIDVLDPAFAPGTNHPEPAGLSTRELLYFIQRLRFLRKNYSADVVEVSPSIDTNNITSRAAARIIAELL